MTLASNTNGILSAAWYIGDIGARLAVHGAHVGVGMLTRSEMKIFQRNLTRSARV